MEDLNGLLIVNDHGDITMFDTYQNALKYLEEEDIIVGSLEFYDARGYKIEPVIRSGTVVGFRRRLGLCEEKRLASLLRAYLERLGHSPGEHELEQMVRLARHVCEVRVSTRSNYLRWAILVLYLALLVVFLHQCPAMPWAQ
jgi:hypothetical protein